MKFTPSMPRIRKGRKALVIWRERYLRRPKSRRLRQSRLTQEERAMDRISARHRYVAIIPPRYIIVAPDDDSIET